MGAPVALSEYWTAVGDDRRGWSLFARVASHVAVPLVVGALALVRPDVPAFESQIVDVVAIVAGLLFTMAVLLIDVRGRVRRGEDRRATPGDRDTRNLDYAYFATNYAIMLGLAITALLILQERFWKALPCWGQIASNWLVFALVVHFGFVVVQCLKRLRRTYEVFGRGNV